MKVPDENKAAQPELVEQPKATRAEKKVLVEILPLRGIGGIGGPGSRAHLPKSVAEQYVRDGYVKIIEEK